MMVFQNVHYFIKYILVGAANTLFGYIVFITMLNIASTELALVISYIFGVIWNFFLYGKIVFDKKTSPIVLIKFIAIYVTLYLINLHLIALLNMGLNLNVAYAQLVLIFPFALTSFLVMKKYVYR